MGKFDPVIVMGKTGHGTFTPVGITLIMMVSGDNLMPTFNEISFNHEISSPEF